MQKFYFLFFSVAFMSCATLSSTVEETNALSCLDRVKKRIEILREKKKFQVRIETMISKKKWTEETYTVDRGKAILTETRGVSAQLSVKGEGDTTIVFHSKNSVAPYVWRDPYSLPLYDDSASTGIGMLLNYFGGRNIKLQSCSNIKDKVIVKGQWSAEVRFEKVDLSGDVPKYSGMGVKRVEEPIEITFNDGLPLELKVWKNSGEIKQWQKFEWLKFEADKLIAPKYKKIKVFKEFPEELSDKMLIP